MNRVGRTTQKLYYEEPYLRKTLATVVRCGETHVELDRTVAFPKGGGQNADHGSIHLENGAVLRFIDVRRVYGYSPRLPDFPDITVGGVIWHVIHPEDQGAIATIIAGSVVEVEIDRERRGLLSLSHTAAHLVFIGLRRIRPDAIAGMMGCEIRPRNARFDFRVGRRLQQTEIEQIAEIACAMVLRDSPIRMSSHPEHSDARTWSCEGHVIPCGGTHIESTGPIGGLIVRRRGLGAGKDRGVAEFPDAHIDLRPYSHHDRGTPSCP